MTRKTLTILTMLMLTACEPTIANRGATLEPEQLAQIKPGVSTREEVATKLGTPTQISTFDDKIWYYIGRQTSQESFFMPTVVKQQAVQVTFNDNGIVTSVGPLDLGKARDVDTVARSTPTYGNDNTFMQQLLGNLGHAAPKVGNEPGHTGP
jgi:outer membrane protein assembly factor BamE (lipoprotein component of BamABCDE complex)